MVWCGRSSIKGLIQWTLTPSDTNFRDISDYRCPLLNLGPLACNAHVSRSNAFFKKKFSSLYHSANCIRFLQSLPQRYHAWPCIWVVLSWFIITLPSSDGLWLCPAPSVFCNESVDSRYIAVYSHVPEPGRPFFSWHCTHTVIIHAWEYSSATGCLGELPWHHVFLSLARKPPKL